MENRITLKNFGYTYSVGRNTIKAYEKEYHNSLTEFLNEYEDNSEAFYLYGLISEWDNLIIEFTGVVKAIRNNDDEVFYYVRNRIFPDGLPDKEDSPEVKFIVEKLSITKDEDERISLYCELAEVWRKEEKEEQKEDEENWSFPNWREVENKELEKSDCIKLLNRNLATCFLFIDFLKKRQKKIQTEIQIEQPQAEIPQLEKKVTQQSKSKTDIETPKTFEELFYNPKDAEPCLKILSELRSPVIDATNNYIGKAKGIFPLWVSVLKNFKPEPLIKHFKDTVYKELLNEKVKGLKLSKDASEFRKQYLRLEKNGIESEIKVLLSQYSQSGKLGK